MNFFFIGERCVTYRKKSNESVVFVVMREMLIMYNLFRLIDE